jgi:hypothetical protein
VSEEVVEAREMVQSTKIEVVTPVKRKVIEIATPKMEFPLTPPATVKSEVTFDFKIEENENGVKVTEHFVRRSKRRRIGPGDPFEDV